MGDGENDQSFFHVCGCAAAVANALTIVSQSADIKLQADHGAGVRELMQRIAYEDSRILPPSRRGILAGVDWHGEPAYLTVEDTVLIVGNSGAGKSSLAILLTERMAQAGFQFCVIDPEGDYLTLQNAAVIGCSARTPETVSALQLLVQAGINVAINAPTLSQPERQSLFATLIPPIQQLRLRSGRPHWVVLDEAHHVLWAAGRGPGGLLADSPSATVLITLDPALLDLKLLRLIDVIIAIGSTAPDLLLSSAQMLKIPISDRVPIVAHDEALLWSPKSGAPPRAIRLEAPRQSHNRHSGKYAVGDVGADHSFYFRGPQNAVNIRACNLSEFITLSDTIDGAVWTHHLHAHDFSAWFRKTIRDDALAQAAEAIERDQTLDDRESRKRVREAISSRYVIPCGKAVG